MEKGIPLFSRPHGFFQFHFYAQECVSLSDEQFGILLDIQAGKALVLLCEQFRERGQNGLLEVSPDALQKMY